MTTVLPRGSVFRQWLADRRRAPFDKALLRPALIFTIGLNVGSLLGFIAYR